jgi:hypothetical protein
MKKLKETETDAKAVRTMTRRIILTEEELVSLSKDELKFLVKITKQITH